VILHSFFGFSGGFFRISPTKMFINNWTFFLRPQKCCSCSFLQKHCVRAASVPSIPWTNFGLPRRHIWVVEQVWCLYPLQGQSSISYVGATTWICITARGYETRKIEGCVLIYLPHVFSLRILRQNSVTCAEQTNVLTAIVCVSHWHKRT